jgi:type I restriction enzyme S subunit
MSELPDGWITASIDDLRSASPNSITDGPFGSNLKTSHYTPSGPVVVRLGNIGSRQFIDADRVHISAKHFAALAKHHVFRGDILVAALGEPIGRACLLPDEVQPALVKADCFRFRPAAELNATYLMLWLNSEDARAHFLTASHGLGRMRINLSDFRNAQVPIAPLSEQKRMVTKIDSLSRKSKRARDHVDNIPRLVEKYKQAILKAAFRGDLTSGWRSRRSEHLAIKPRNEPGKNKKVTTDQDFVAPYELPDRWLWLRLAQIGEYDRGRSRHRPRNDKRLFGGPYPFIQTGDVRAADRFLTSYSQTLNDFGLSQSRLWPKGTVCITIAANIAETAILGIEAAFPDSVVGFIADAERVSPSYVEFFMRTARDELAAFAPATAQKNINLEILSQVRLPIAPLEEQKEIVECIVKMSSWIDRLASETTSARKLIDHLDQSILAKAFRGELVPQNPNDEPASVLLERIRVDLEVKSSTKRPTIKKKK